MSMMNTESKKYWFLRLVRHSGVLRVRPLEGQTIVSSNGAHLVLTETPVDHEKNVTTEKGVREKVPINTIFVTDSLAFMGSFYRAGNLSTIEAFPDVQLCPPEAYRQYTSLCLKLGIDAVPYGGSMVAVASTTEPTKKSTPLSRLMNNKKFAPPTIVDDGFYVNPDVWYFLLHNVIKREPTMLTGPTGTGKTEIVQLIASRMHKEYHEIDMAGMLDPVSGLIGTHRFEDGGSVFDYARYTQVVTRDAIVLLDELSRPTAQTNNILLPGLDRRRYVPVEIASSKLARRIDFHEDCVIFATANLGAEYTGTHQMDRALKDRFTEVEFNYLPPHVESDLLATRTKAEKIKTVAVVSIINDIRDLYKSGDISSTVSTRHALKIAGLISYGYELIPACSLIILPLFEGGDVDSERVKIENLLKSK